MNIPPAIHPIPSNSPRKLYHDILLGTAVGDTLGFPAQFHPREE